MRGRLVEANKKLPAWRKASEEPLEVLITFYLARPKTVKRKHASVKPDIDKLIRGTLDPLTQAGVIKDDALVVEVSARKEYCEPGQEGAWIQIVETF
jgi:Holliday junction resolvase RusA-like endonuclease